MRGGEARAPPSPRALNHDNDHEGSQMKFMHVRSLAGLPHEMKGKCRQPPLILPNYNNYVSRATSITYKLQSHNTPGNIYHLSCWTV